jgi:hypothetical protein
MDNFELKPEKKKVNRKSLIWNFLTVVVLLSICCLGYYFVTVFTNPNSPLNFFPPEALPTQYQTNTPTVTIVQRPATWTPTQTIQPSPSRTKAPTWTPLPGMVTPPTSTMEPTESTPTITTTPMPASANITFQASTDFHPEDNCDWLGVAGKVLGKDGKPLQFQEIQLGGTLDGKAISFLTLSGTASAYGSSGFEMVLSDHTIASTQTLWIQLLDNTAKPLTDKIYFETYDDCSQNLMMIIFTKTR